MTDFSNPNVMFDAMYGFTGPLIVVYIVSLGWCLINLVPSLSISIRRLHDTGRSWHWFLLCLIPIAGGIILLVLHIEESKFPPENPFGLLKQV